MDWKAHMAETAAATAALRRAEPDTAAGFSALHKAAMAEGDLTVKTKELIALAIGITSRCADCIGFHARAAAKAGATRAEVAEAVGVAVSMGGGPAFMYGAKALEAFDQLSE